MWSLVGQQDEILKSVPDRKMLLRKLRKLMYRLIINFQCKSVYLDSLVYLLVINRQTDRQTDRSGVIMHGCASQPENCWTVKFTEFMATREECHTLLYKLGVCQQSRVKKSFFFFFFFFSSLIDRSQSVSKYIFGSHLPFSPGVVLCYIARSDLAFWEEKCY